MISETSKIRFEALRFIKPMTNGIDLGFGGDAITRCAIAMDLEWPYTNVGSDPQHLQGDARNLHWFKNGVLDYVYSSHLLEDFENTTEVLCEWLRVLKPGGKLILYLPDEGQFRKHCDKTGQPYNPAHKVPQMSLAYMRAKFTHLDVKVHAFMDHPPYSFLIVGEK